MRVKISLDEISSAIKQVLSIGELRDNSTSVICYDLGLIEEKINYIKGIYPPTVLHAIAVKANPLVKILENIKGLEVGLEVASLPELYIAHKIGYESNKIIFDSPSKTIDELKFALEIGACINADSFSELNKINELLSGVKSQSAIGLRINPQIGQGKIKSTSVADKISKFGVPLEQNSKKIIEAYSKFEWLTGIHLHIGSQGTSINQLVTGLEKVYNLAVEIEERLSDTGRKIEFFDMGGGFPVSYNKDSEGLDMSDYVDEIKNKIPKFFQSDKKIITEFGRYIYANSAFAVSRVEYVKEEENYKILSIHLGADFLLRKAYNPTDWHHELSIFDSSGNLKTGIDFKKYIVAGPLCFAGDVIAKNIELPIVEEGDFLVIHDVGAYTLSMWSRYNSRQIPSVLGFNKINNAITTLKKRESLDDLYDFWS